MSEPLLQINGLGLSKPTDPIVIPGDGGIVAPVVRNTTTTTPGTTSTNKGGGFWSGSNIGDVLNSIVKMGNAGANIIAALKGNQPVFIQNPTTGQQIDVREELKKQAEAQGKSNEQMLQLMQMMMQNNQKPTPKNNTALYVGVGVGVVVLSGLLYLIATKKKK